MNETTDKPGELINKYLNDIATDEEVAELDGMLVESRDVAREFARMSRQDGYLLEHFWEEQAAPAMEKDVGGRGRILSFSAVIRAIAAAVVVGLAIWMGTRIGERGRGPSPVAGPDGQAVAKVDAASGDVRWASASGREGSLKTGDPVLEGMRIETGEDGRMKWAYIGEETSVEAGEKTECRIGREEHRTSNTEHRTSNEGKNLYLTVGKLAVVVAPQPEGKVFTVVTPHAEAQVVGTAFNMLVDAKASALDVFDGMLRYTRLSDGKKLELRRGQGATAGEGAEFILRRCKYYAGSDYADGQVLFQDDLTAGLDNWDVVVSTNGRSFRLATSEEAARIVRPAQPDDGWQRPTEAKGMVLVAGKGETVALRLKKALPVVPLSVEFVRQAAQQSSIHVFYGNVLEEEMVRELPHNIFEPGGPLKPRREMIPLETRGNAEIVEERRFIWGMPWYIYRIAVAKRDGVHVTIGISGDRRKAVFTDVTIREMTKIEGAK